MGFVIIFDVMYTYDSRKINKGDIFICLPGGEAYIEQALAQGAEEVIQMSRPEMAVFADKLYGSPSKKMKVVGVTGTNGKTTVTHLTAQALREAGFKPYVLGTMNSDLTTPESLDIQKLMADHLNTGGTHFIMEVSSHGIDQSRVLAIDFDVKLLTNITQDHLDYHKTIREYKRVKQHFMQMWPGLSIMPEQFKMIELPFPVPLPGRFNYENIQAATAILRALDSPDSSIFQSMRNAKAPAGRFEQILLGQPFKVIVDYAHTPDGLKNVLIEGRHMADQNQGRLAAVFGCGGDRDRNKRHKMAGVAETYSDFVFVTQDNPRTESQSQIIADIIKGFSKEFKRFKHINERDKAIREAVFWAGENDVVIIAGKGHEDYQILETGKIHFDDREKASEALNERGYVCVAYGCV
ncbi:Mur ligase family protein [Thermoproteota archaeon]